jgi:hypothetical protein
VIAMAGWRSASWLIVVLAVMSGFEDELRQDPGDDSHILVMDAGGRGIEDHARPGAHPGAPDVQSRHRSSCSR